MHGSDGGAEGCRSSPLEQSTQATGNAIGRMDLRSRGFAWAALCAHSRLGGTAGRLASCLLLLTGALGCAQAQAAVGAEAPLLSGYGGPGAGEQVILSEQRFGQGVPSKPNGPVGGGPAEGLASGGTGSRQEAAQRHPRSQQRPTGAASGGGNVPPTAPGSPSAAKGVAQGHSSARSAAAQRLGSGSPAAADTVVEGRTIGLIVGLAVVVLAAAVATRRIARTY